MLGPDFSSSSCKDTRTKCVCRPTHLNVDRIFARGEICSPRLAAPSGLLVEATLCTHAKKHRVTGVDRLTPLTRRLVQLSRKGFRKEGRVQQRRPQHKCASNYMPPQPTSKGFMTPGGTPRVHQVPFRRALTQAPRLLADDRPLHQALSALQSVGIRSLNREISKTRLTDRPHDKTIVQIQNIGNPSDTGGRAHAVADR